MFIEGAAMVDVELDGIIYSLQRFGGASRYWRELASRLPAELPTRTIQETSVGRLARFRSPTSKAKIFHSSHFRISSTKGPLNVATIYDLIYERKLARGLGAYLNLYERRRAVSKADVIICISESTRQDMLEFYGDVVRNKPIHTIPLGCYSVEMSSFAAFDAPHFLGDIGAKFIGFFLFVGGRGAYKNFDLLLKSFVNGKFLQEGFAVVCTGAAFSLEEIARLDDLGLSQCVFSAGIVGDLALQAMYKSAVALVYPSAYEGFGLPPLEAMAAGCPVICANISSLPEVVGDGGLLVEPDSVENLAHAMLSLLSEDVRRHFVQNGLARSRQFSWHRTTLLHARVYDSLGVF